jgi:primary-amine oxidase
LQFNANLEPYIQEYMVGPLPISKATGTYGSSSAATKYEELNYQYNSGRGRTRVFNADAEAIAEFNLVVGADIKDITKTLLNGVSGLTPHTLNVSMC